MLATMSRAIAWQKNGLLAMFRCSHADAVSLHKHNVQAMSMYIYIYVNIYVCR